MTRRFHVSRRTTRVGVIMYTSSPRLLLRLSSWGGNVIKILPRIRLLGGRRYTGRALHHAKNVLFRGQPECGRKRVLVILTSGYSVDNVVSPSRALNAKGVEIFAVMTNYRTMNQYKNVLLTKRHGIVVSYRASITIIQRLASKICYTPKGKKRIYISASPYTCFRCLSTKIELEVVQSEIKRIIAKADFRPKWLNRSSITT